MSEEHICDKELNQFKIEVQLLKKKSKDLKESYMQALIENAKRDLTIRELDQQIVQHKYQLFGGKLSATCLEKIKSIDCAEKEDTNFVHLILKDIYGESLHHKTLTGQTASGKNDSEISLRVKMLLKDIFNHRVCHLSIEVRDARVTKLNKLEMQSTRKKNDKIKYKSMQIMHVAKDYDLPSRCYSYFSY